MDKLSASQAILKSSSYQIPHKKGQKHRALMFSLVLSKNNLLINKNPVAGDLSRHDAHMTSPWCRFRFDYLIASLKQSDEISRDLVPLYMSEWNCKDMYAGFAQPPYN